MVIHKVIIERWRNASERSKLAAKNIAVSLCLKCTSIITSLMVVPLTIDYLDSSQYGIWLAISSIISWVSFFDLGLANGFKNKFSEAKANNDISLAREYVSTTYLTIAVIVSILFIFTILANSFIDWASVLNVSHSYELILKRVFGVLALIFCLNMITNIFAKLVEADQRPAIASLISCIGQVLSLVSIYLLTKFTTGGLLNLAIYFSSIPVLTMVVASIIMFNFTHYRVYRPTFINIRLILIRNIMGLGVKFFLIYLCLIVIFQFMNIILSRECGTVAVTQYNVTYKYFSVAYMVAIIMISPMWAAFTDAYTKKDFKWMRSMFRKLEKGIIIGIVVCILGFLLSSIAFKLWIGNSVMISNTLSFGVMLYVISQIAGAVYMQMINGCGTMHIQFIIYLFFAVISYPLMVISCKLLGTVGIVVVPTLVYVIQATFGRIQIIKIINQTAFGVWGK